MQKLLQAFETLFSVIALTVAELVYLMGRALVRKVARELGLAVRC